MNLKKWSPWNWMGKEEEGDGSKSVPVSVKQGYVHPMARMHHEIDQLFDNMVQNFGFQPAASLAGLLKPQLDIQEKQDKFVISVEVPGVDEKDIEISLEDDTLTIRGEKKHSHEQKNEKYHRVERTYGAFQRVLILPENANKSAIKARFNKGVLTLDIAKLEKEVVRGRQIEIEKT